MMRSVIPFACGVLAGIKRNWIFGNLEEIIADNAGSLRDLSRAEEAARN
jgi:hypothetical protein